MCVENVKTSVLVAKRDGTSEAFDIKKIRKQTKDACENLAFVSYEELELGVSLYLTDGIKTSDIQKSLIETALRLNSIEKPNYIYVAGRLALYDLYHELISLYGKDKSKYKNVYEAISIKDIINTYRSELGDYIDTYSEDEIDYLNKIIDPSQDLLFSYPAVTLLLKTYLNRSSWSSTGHKQDKDQTRVIELPQHMFLLMAMFNCHQLPKDKRLAEVEVLYSILSKQYFIPATPHLSSARTKAPQLASCLVTSIDDDLDSISDRIREVIFGSSVGAGFGIDASRVRSISAPIRGYSRRSKGKVPLLKVLDSVAFYIDQCGRRPGAFSVTIRVWDVDLQSFLDIRKAQGEERLRARNIHPAVAVDNVFMSRVKKFYEGDTEITYTCFNPYDVKDLCDTYGEDFERRYLAYEKKFQENPELFCPGTKVEKVKDIYSSIILSICTNHYPYITYIDTVNEANPHPEFGPIRCGNLCVHGDTLVTTDTGVYPIRELNDQFVNVWNGETYSCTRVAETGTSDCYEVTFENGSVIKCTPEHRFTMSDGAVKSTVNLKIGEYIKEEGLPDTNKAIKFMDKSVIDYLSTTLSSVRVTYGSSYITDYPVYTFLTGLENTDKVFSYLRSIGIDCRIRRESIRFIGVCVIKKDFMKLLDLGIISGKEVDRILDSYEYQTDVSHRLKAGYSKFRVKSVNKLPFKFDSYCFTEEKRNMGMFNGITTMNCQEVMLPADKDEMAVCNLGSINLGKVDPKDKELLEYVTKYAVRYLDRTIDITEYPSDCAKRTQERMRSIGLGVVGEAERIAHMQIEYGSDEHKEFIEDVYGFIRNTAHGTSVELAKELGPCEAIANPPVRNGYLMCIAPNTNTGIFASTTSGCEPVYGREWIEDNGACTSLRMTAPNINIDNYKYYKNGFSLDPLKMIEACAIRQKYIDMSISFSLFLKTDGISAKWLGSVYLYAWEQGVKSMYYIRSDGVNDTTDVKCENCAN